ncbi:MAG: DUF4349 domain-containing protein [Microbacterium sp.]
MNAGERAEASLPELSAQRIDEIEDALFADIARERTARRAKRGRIWMGGAAAAAVIVVAAVIAPSVGNLVGSAGGSADEYAVAPDAPAVAPVAGGAGDGAVTEGTKSSDASSLTGMDQGAVDPATGDRDIITSASATVVVEDVAVAARTVGNAAVAKDGYVESMSIGTSGGAVPVDPATGIAYDSMIYPYSPDGAWITVRVPSDQLAPLIEELSDVGEVTASSINRQDVTEQTVDLEARIDASQASVDRLTELMGQAGSLTELIAAEAALAERQATLESYQQQLESLEGLVQMSSLTVTLTPEVETVEADPAGFSDGLAAGWNGLVATLNGIVIALGFLIPWIVVLAVVGLIVWGIVRLVRRPRSTRDAAPTAPAETTRSDDSEPRAPASE